MAAIRRTGEETASIIQTVRTVPADVSAAIRRTGEETVSTIQTVRTVPEDALAETETTREPTAPAAAASDREMKEEAIPEENRA